MKKVELLIGLGVLVSLVLNFLRFPIGAMAGILSLFLLSMFYFFFSFALFSGAGVRNLFQKSAYQGISAGKIVGAVFLGCALSSVIIGALFFLQYWFGAYESIGLGLLGLGIAFVIAAIKYAKSKAPFYKRVLIRIALYGGIGLVLLSLPPNAWIQAKFRNHPAYLEAFENFQEDPNNPVLLEKLKEEEAKIEEEK